MISIYQDKVQCLGVFCEDDWIRRGMDSEYVSMDARWWEILHLQRDAAEEGTSILRGDSGEIGLCVNMLD